jgi:hypothetical protein
LRSSGSFSAVLDRRYRRGLWRPSERVKLPVALLKNWDAPPLFH